MMSLTCASCISPGIRPGWRAGCPARSAVMSCILTISRSSTQPTGGVTGVEALLRWTHPARGPVAPTVFIPFAEQSGQIIELGRWVLEQACADRQHWQAAFPDGDRDVGQRVRAPVHVGRVRADRAGGPGQHLDTDPALLTLEVTESVFVRDEERALVVLEELKEIGVNLALDDFGTGYSSLGYLNTLPIDTIKVDQTFIAKLSDTAWQPGDRRRDHRTRAQLGMTVVSKASKPPNNTRGQSRWGQTAARGSTSPSRCSPPASTTSSTIPPMAAPRTSPPSPQAARRQAARRNTAQPHPKVLNAARRDSEQERDGSRID